MFKYILLSNGVLAAISYYFMDIFVDINHLIYFTACSFVFITLPFLFKKKFFIIKIFAKLYMFFLNLIGLLILIMQLLAMNTKNIVPQSFAYKNPGKTYNLNYDKVYKLTRNLAQIHKESGIDSINDKLSKKISFENYKIVLEPVIEKYDELYQHLKLTNYSPYQNSGFDEKAKLQIVNLSIIKNLFMIKRFELEFLYINKDKELNNKIIEHLDFYINLLNNNDNLIHSMLFTKELSRTVDLLAKFHLEDIVETTKEENKVVETIDAKIIRKIDTIINKLDSYAKRCIMLEYDNNISSLRYFNNEFNNKKPVSKYVKYFKTPIINYNDSYNFFYTYYKKVLEEREKTIHNRKLPNLNKYEKLSYKNPVGYTLALATTPDYKEYLVSFDKIISKLTLYRYIIDKNEDKKAPEDILTEKAYIKRKTETGYEYASTFNDGKDHVVILRDNPPKVIIEEKKDEEKPKTVAKKSSKKKRK